MAHQPDPREPNAQPQPAHAAAPKASQLKQQSTSQQAPGPAARLAPPASSPAPVSQRALVSPPAPSRRAAVHAPATGRLSSERESSQAARRVLPVTPAAPRTVVAATSRAGSPVKLPSSATARVSEPRRQPQKRRAGPPGGRPEPAAIPPFGAPHRADSSSTMLSPQPRAPLLPPEQSLPPFRQPSAHQHGENRRRT